VRRRASASTTESGEAAKRAIHALTFRPAGQELAGYFVFDEQGRALVVPYDGDQQPALD